MMDVCFGSLVDDVYIVEFENIISIQSHSMISYLLIQTYLLFSILDIFIDVD